MVSELVAPEGGSSEINPAVPGATQYLQSLANIALNICVDSPHLWQCLESERIQKDLLMCLLQCQHYEIRLFTLERLLERLQRAETESQRGLWPFEACVSSLTCLALHETHPGCQAKVRKETIKLHQTLHTPTLTKHNGMIKHET